MSLQTLLDGQTVIIDDHRRGSGEIKDWDDSSADIHIHKETKFQMDGKKQNVTIKVPLNSDTPISITSRKTKGSKQKHSEIPSKLHKEIKKAFKNKTKRKNFIEDVFDTLKDFGSILSNEKEASKVLKRISNHFDLKWTEKKIATYANDLLIQYTQIYTNEDDKKYHITIGQENIKISDTTSYSRVQTLINNK